MKLHRHALHQIHIGTGVILACSLTAVILTSMMSDYPLLLLALVPVTGFVAGFINTLAGSGSLITLPLLILLGLPATVANGTNRVGILLQNIVAVSTFKRHGALDGRKFTGLIVPSFLGGIVGALLAVDIDEIVLRRTIGVLMIFMLFVVLLRPKRWLDSHDQTAALPYPAQFILFFAIGAYGGFIQAGVGIFLMAGLVLGAGYNLVSTSAIKNTIVLFFTIAALAIFILNDQVHWGLGLLLAVGNATGGWVAAHMAIAKGAQFIRWVLISILAISSIALLLDNTTS